MLGTDFLNKYRGANDEQHLTPIKNTSNTLFDTPVKNNPDSIQKSIFTLLDKHCPSEAHHQDLRGFVMACLSIGIDTNTLLEYSANIMVRVSSDSSYNGNNKQLEELIVDIAKRYPHIEGKNIDNSTLKKPTKPTKVIDWLVPQALEQPLPSVLSLEADMLPEGFKIWLEDIAKRMKCPFDYVAVTAIVMLGSVIGAKCGIKPKQKDDWLVIPNLWGGIVGSPSQLKTPSTTTILKALGKLEANAMSDFKLNKADYEADKEFLKAKKEAVKKELQKAVKTDEQTQINKLKSEIKQFTLAVSEEPSLKRYKVNDSTVEKLADLLKENPNGLLVFRDELIGLLASWEKAGHEGDRAFYLESWNGYNSYTVDRVMKGTHFIERLCLSVFGGIQPSKLSGYLHKLLHGENDGMLQRFQLMVYPDEPKNWTYTDEYPDNEAKNRAYDIVQRLAEFIPSEYGAIQTEFEDLPFFRFSLEAQEIFKQWQIQLENDKLRSGEYSPFMIEHLAKYRSLMPSLALIFHLVNCVDRKETNGRVTVEATKQAVRWCEYLESHATRIYQGLGNTIQLAALELSKKIKSGKLKDKFTVRDIQRKGWSLLTSNNDIKEAIHELVNANWIVEQEQDNRGGRPPASIYVINPKINKSA